MADAEAAAVLQAQINAAVVAALAAQAAAAVPAQIAHVAVKLPEFWVKDPKMWFSQAEAQFRRARVTAQTTNFLSTQVPPFQCSLIGPLPPLQVPSWLELTVSPFLPGER
jgi:hypothetical protein